MNTEDSSFFEEEWLHQRRVEGDVMGEVPAQWVLKDERYDETFRGRLKGPFAVVDETLKEISKTSVGGGALDVHGRVDNELEGWIKRIVYHIYRSNCELQGRDYTQAELKILVWEMWYVDHLHGVADYGQQERHDGSSYSRGHLFAALLNAVTLTGITDLAFLLAVLHHDDFEDLKKIHPEGAPQRDKLLASAHYKDSLGERSRTVKALTDRLFNLVRGVTNVKKTQMKKSDQEVLNTKELIAKMLEYEPLVMVVRFCDRLNNLQTLDGMRDAGKDKSADSKIMESLERLAPASLLLGLREVYKAMVKACFEDSNKEAVDSFNRLRDQRIAERVNPSTAVGVELMVRLQGVLSDPAVAYAAYRPKSFFEPEYCQRDKVFDKEYQATKGVDDLDPLFRVEILVEESEQVDAVRAKLLTALTPGSRTGVDERRGILHVHNPKLGRRIEARIRTVREARLDQRGVFTMNQTIETTEGPRYGLEVKKNLPEELEARIARFLGMLTEETPIEMVRELIRVILLQPTRVALTPEEESIELPVGATVVDFARAISAGTLRKCVGALRRANPAVGDAERLDPFDRVFPALEADPMVEVMQGEKQQVKPGWKMFSDIPLTLNSIGHRLEELPRETQMELGNEHLEEVSALLDIPLNDVMDLLWPKGQTFPTRSIQERVGAGEINPLEELSEKVEAKDGINFEVDLPNDPGVLQQFLERFGRPFINLIMLKGQNDYEADGGQRTKLRLRFENREGTKVPLYELLRLAYQISQVHPIKVASTRFTRLAQSLRLEAISA